MSKRSGVFDMIGPVMIGPSSSHTAGVVRIGRVARRVFGKDKKFEKVNITFYNSFARTYEGHGSDRAILAGLMDMHTDDPQIKEALAIAKDSGMQYHFRSVGNASTFHPNTVKVELEGAPSRSVVVGESLGGGVINIAEIDGFRAGFGASSHTLIIKAMDVKGMIAFVSSVLSMDDCNIASMSVSRKGKNDLACHVIEMDSGIRQETLIYLRSLKYIEEVIYIPDIDF